MNFSNTIAIVSHGLKSIQETNYILGESSKDELKMTFTIDFEEKTKEQIIDDLPKKSNNVINNEDDEKCPICWDKLEGELQKGRKCQHYFHQECLQEWLKRPQQSLICPLCQQNL